MTPTYAVKGGRRYRYYVSAPLVRGEPSANGVRAPASDLERVVIDGIVSRLRNHAWVSQQLGSGLDAAGTERLLQAAAKLAAAITDGPHAPSPELARHLIARVVLGDKEVAISIDRAAGHLRKALARG